MESIYFKYNTDKNGNPMAINITNENKQISPINFAIQLEQIPDEFYRLQIAYGNTELFEIFEKDEITENSYYVDYIVGTVYFHTSKAGKIVNIKKYYGRGVELISANRVFTKIDGNIVTSLGSLMDSAKEIIDDANNALVNNGILKENFKKIVLASELVLNPDSGFYEYKLNHGLNSTKLCVSVKELETGYECVNLCDCIDANNLLVRNDENVSLMIIINYGSVSEVKS